MIVFYDEAAAISESVWQSAHARKDRLMTPATITQHFDIDIYRESGEARDKLELSRAIERHLRKRRNAERYRRMMLRRDSWFMLGAVNQPERWL
jgi:hypothetical protein